MSSTSQWAMSELKTGCSRAPNALARENANDMRAVVGLAAEEEARDEKVTQLGLGRDLQVAELVELRRRYADRRDVAQALAQVIDRVEQRCRRTWS